MKAEGGRGESRGLRKQWKGENTFDLPNQVVIPERKIFCVSEIRFDLWPAHVRPSSPFISYY